MSRKAAKGWQMCCVVNGAGEQRQQRESFCRVWHKKKRKGTSPRLKAFFIFFSLAFPNNLRKPSHLVAGRASAAVAAKA